MLDCKIKLRFTSTQKQSVPQFTLSFLSRTLQKHILVCLPRKGMHFLMTNNVCGCNADSILGLKFSKRGRSF